MVWGGIQGGKKCDPILWNKNNWETITAKSYVDNVLIPVLPPFWQRESEHTAHPLWLMEDDASAHWAHPTRWIREQYSILKLTWPPASPDCNPIENV